MRLRIAAACIAVCNLALTPTACADEAPKPDTPPAVESVTAPELPAEPPALPVSPTAAGASVGRVSYYGRELAGRRTTSGERFNPELLTMAHPTLPFGTLVRVTNLRNNRSVIVRVNDRGPHTGQRIGDVSIRAARELHMLGAGVVQARLEVVNTSAQELSR